MGPPEPPQATPAFIMRNPPGCSLQPTPAQVSNFDTNGSNGGLPIIIFGHMFSVAPFSIRDALGCVMSPCCPRPGIVSIKLNGLSESLLRWYRYHVRLDATLQK